MRTYKKSFKPPLFSGAVLYFYSSLFKGTQIKGCTVCTTNTSLNKLWTSPTWDMKQAETSFFTRFRQMFEGLPKKISALCHFRVPMYGLFSAEILYKCSGNWH